MYECYFNVFVLQKRNKLRNFDITALKQEIWVKNYYNQSFTNVKIGIKNPF